LADESRKNFGKIKLGKFSAESEIFLENREGESETEGNASLPQRGMNTPEVQCLNSDLVRT